MSCRSQDAGSARQKSEEVAQLSPVSRLIAPHATFMLTQQVLGHLR